MARRAAPTRLVAAAGLTVQAVTLVVLTVSLAHTAATIGDGDRDGRASFSAFVDDLFGPAIDTAAAIVVGLFAVLLLVAVSLAAQRGGAGVAGLVVGLVVQVPVTGVAARNAVVGEAGAGEIALLVGAGLLLVAVVLPSTWRRTPLPDPHPGPGSSSSGGPSAP